MTLALLYAMPLAGSSYRGNANIRAWAQAGLRFWARRQHRDGSFDEYYPYEHGYIPTSFSLYAAAEACRVLEWTDDAVVAACARAAHYLAGTAERQALNQESAAIPGLYATYLLTGEARIKAAAEDKLVRLCQLQSCEGWFAEYGGADIGYLSTTLDFLAEYWRMSEDERAYEACEKIVDFARYFVHQDGSAGGQYGSRNTEYFLLSGLSAMADRSAAAAAMLARLRHQTGQAEWAYAAFDDRYLCHNMLHSLLRAVRNAPAAMLPPVLLPCETDHERYFSESGLLSMQRGGSHLICGVKKGGVVRLFSGGREVFRDFGYRLEEEPGRMAATNWLNHELAVRCEGDLVEVAGPLTEVPQQAITPWRHMALRLAAKVLGRRLIPNLKKRLIFVDRRSPARFARAIRTGGQRLEVEDRIELAGRGGRLYQAGKFSLRHVASSKYYQPDELAAVDGDGWQDVGEVVVRRHIDWSTGAVESAVATN